MRVIAVLFVLIGGGIASAIAQVPDPAITPKGDEPWKVRVIGNFDPAPKLVVAGFDDKTRKTVELSKPDVQLGTVIFKLSKEDPGNYTFVVSGAIRGKPVHLLGRIRFTESGEGRSIDLPGEGAAGEGAAGEGAAGEGAAGEGGQGPPAIKPVDPRSSPLESAGGAEERKKTIVTDVDYGLTEFTKQAVEDAKRPYFDHHPIVTTEALSELLLRTARAALASGVDRKKLAQVKQDYKKGKDKLLAAKPGRKDDWAYVLRLLDNQVVKLKEEGKLDYDKPRDMAAIYEEIGIAFADLAGQFKDQRVEEDTLMEEYLKQGRFGFRYVTVNPDRSGKRKRRRCNLWGLIFGY